MSTKQSDSKFASLCTKGFCKSKKPGLLTDAGAYSDIGTTRKSNDDLVFAGRDCRLFVVLDGIGGHLGGATASRVVLDKLRGHFELMCASSVDESDLRRTVRRALNAAVLEMISISHSTPAYERMGTVFSLAYIAEDKLLYTHVGDCRIYLVRNGKAKQLTSDETYVQLLTEMGAIKPEEVSTHPMKNVVLNAVGAKPMEQLPMFESCQLRAGDVVVLTSDGVSDRLSPDELTELLSRESCPDDSARAIVQRALDNGSRDNASCVVVELKDALKEGKMPSKREFDLHAELQRLHSELQRIDNVDESIRDDLLQISSDIQVALKDDSDASLATDLHKKMQDRLLEFETKHPTLTNIVGAIANVLSGFGI